MKANIDAIIRHEHAVYLEGLLPHRDELLAEMEKYSAEHSIPSSDPEVALFLDITVRATRAARILEIGTAIGYTAVWMARAAPEGALVTTIDPDGERVVTAREFIRRAGLDHKIEIVQAEALHVLPQLAGPFDLVYIDAVKSEYSAYLELLIPRIRMGGAIIADNVLWKGQVATGKLLSPDQRESTEALAEFNRRFTTHPSLRALILPFGDGLAYGVRV